MSKKIVAADDETHILSVVSLKLGNAGYEVLRAEDGEEALELCTTQVPDLLITDYQMPLMTGLELCRELRKNDALRHIPAVMLTARGFDIEPEEMTEAGIETVITKPFAPRKLLETVNEILQSNPVTAGTEEQ